MNQAKQKKYNSKKGFSLVEVLITLAILAIGLTAVSVLMINNIKSSQTAKNQIIASQLAQEAIELVRNLKDSKDPNFCDTLTANPITLNDYVIDKANAQPAATTNVSQQRLYLNSNFYTHNSAGTSTKFFRSISLKVEGDRLASPSTRVTTVTSYVSWNGTGMPTPANCNVANKCLSVVSIMPD